MKTTTFENAKVGDKVWCITSGWGEVRGIDFSKAYSIGVYFTSDEFKTYTVDGRYTEDDLNQTLFWDEVVFEAPSKPLPKLNVDDKVLVWDDGDTNKCKRYFSHFDGSKVACFDSGCTSFSTPHRYRVTYWDNFELYTGE